MPVDPRQQPYLLSQAQNQLLFSNYILADAFDETVPAVKPKAIFLGGQSGSGKSGLSLAVQRELPQLEGAVVINSDALREYHPDFSILQKTDVSQASYLVNPDTHIWQQNLTIAAIASKRNLILDGTLGGSPEPIKETVEILRDNGYFVQLSVLAVPARLSRFGIYKRYEDQVALKGAGRWVGMENHDRLYRDIPITLAVLENSGNIDCIQVFIRTLSPSGLFLLAEKEKKAHEWQWRPLELPFDWNQPESAFKALWEARNRPWTAEEQSAFSMAVQAVAEQMRQRGVIEEEIATFYRHVEWPS